jgi:hypothetical protein
MQDSLFIKYPLPCFPEASPIMPAKNRHYMTRVVLLGILSCSLLIKCADNPTQSGTQTGTQAKTGTFLLDYEVYYSSDGTYDGYVDYKYNEQGNLSERTSYRADSTIEWQYQYEYNASGLKTKEIEITPPNPMWPYDTGTTHTSTVYLYDNSNKLIKTLHYNDSARLVSFSRYEYNQFGLESKYTDYGLDSVPTYWCTWQYDSRDSVIKTINYNKDSTVDDFDTYQYNQWGVVRFVMCYSDSTVEGAADMGYDSLGRMITEVITVRNIVDNYRFAYDANGNMASESFCYSRDSCRVEDAFFYVQYLGKALNKTTASVRTADRLYGVDWKDVLNKQIKGPSGYSLFK